MAAIEKLMQRLGYAKLGRYGLVLTPEGRVLSLRPAVLDDGLGARVVGWRDSDLAAAELAAWQPAPSLVSPAAPRATAPPVAVSARTISPFVPVVAAPPVEEPAEDDWEWTIALARARAMEDDVIVRVAAPRAPVMPPPAPPAAKTAPMRTPRSRTAPMTIPPPVVETRAAAPKPAPAAAAAVKTERMQTVEPDDADIWPKTEEFAVAHVAAAPRATVIPVPTLPRITTGQHGAYRPAPVVRAPGLTPAPPRRFARGTRPVDQDVIAAGGADRTETQVRAAPPTDETKTQVKTAIGVVSLPSLPSIAGPKAGRAAPPQGGAVGSPKQRTAGR